MVPRRRRVTPVAGGAVYGPPADGQRRLRRAVLARGHAALRRRRRRPCPTPRSAWSAAIRSSGSRRGPAAAAGHWRDRRLPRPRRSWRRPSARWAADLGSVDRLLGILEDLQVPLAEVRERLGIPGMGAEAPANFRDKARMKARARARPACRAPGTGSSASRRGRLGVRRQCRLPARGQAAGRRRRRNTFRVDDAEQLGQWLAAAPPSRRPTRCCSRSSWSARSTPSTASSSTASSCGTRSAATCRRPLDVLEHPWIQWCVLLPREIDGRGYADIRDLADPRLARPRAAHRACRTWSGSAAPTARSPSPRSAPARPAPSS